MSLLRGRIRLSTVLIALVFIVTLATYLLVRPVPASSSGNSVSTPSSVTSQPTPTPTRVFVSPTPTAATSHPSRSPTALPGAPISPSPSHRN
jgi:cytoskeletal protein RodZ